SVTRQEDMPHAHLRDAPVMNAKVAAPMKRGRLHSSWRALTKNLAYKVQRRNIAFSAIDCRYDAPASGAHRENGERPEFTGTELQLVRRKIIVRLDVRQHERVLIFSSLKGQAQRPTDHAMSAIATHDEGDIELNGLALL